MKTSAPYQQEFEALQVADDLKRLHDLKAMQQRIGGRYISGGKAHERDLSKASLADCLLQLHAVLLADWPLSFVQVTPLYTYTCRAALQCPTSACHNPHPSIVPACRHRKSAYTVMDVECMPFQDCIVT